MASKKSPTNKELLLDIQQRLEGVESRLDTIQEDEQLLGDDEDRELDELAKLESLEKEIQADVASRPLTRITYHDFTKGIIGAFFGIVGHFAFFYGAKIAQDISLVRAHALFVTSLALLVVFLYFSGFRRVQRSGVLIPLRVLIIYVTAHVVIAFVLFLFGMIDVGMSAVEVYKNVASVSILAVMGAATADLLGAEE